MREPYVWRPVGGHPVLDLANTVSWRTDPARRIDRLAAPAELVRWAAAVGLVDSHQEQSLRRAVETAHHAELLARVVRLRGAVTALLDATIDGRQAAADAVLVVRSAWEQAIRTADIGAAVPLRWTISPRTPRALVDLLGLAAGDLLRSAQVASVRRCDGAGCGWLFLDTTRNHSRRWCDSADCGNRARGQRHRAKVAHTVRR